MLNIDVREKSESVSILNIEENKLQNKKESIDLLGTPKSKQ